MRIDPFVAHCLELLAPLGTARARRMFGGHGLYLDELFVAIIASEQLYLKTDATSTPRFQAAGGQPFVYEMKTGTGRLHYWTPPPEALESPAELAPWVRLAQQAALSARAAAAPKAAAPKTTARKTAARKTAAKPNGKTGTHTSANATRARKPG